MKTMIPAADGTYLLVPRLIPSESDPADTFYDKTRVPVLGWMNFANAADDAPMIRTGATPVVPFWPDGVSQAAGYLIPDGFGGFSISVVYAHQVFSGANAMAQYDSFAEMVLREIEEERDQENSISGESVQREAREDRDERSVTAKLPAGTFQVTPEEDKRPYGETLSGKSRRVRAEIEADEAYLAAIESTGKTIRAANFIFKKTPSRTAVLAALAGTPAEPARAPLGDDDEDLIG